MIPESLASLGTVALVVAAGLALAWVLQPPPRRPVADNEYNPAPTEPPPEINSRPMGLGLADLAAAPEARAKVEVVLRGDGVFEALLSRPDLHTPAGFVATAEGRVWTLEPNSPLAPLDDEVDWPLLVAVGDTDAGRCHLNLQALGLVAISGPQTQSLATRIAGQLVERASRDEVELVLVGGGDGTVVGSSATVEDCGEALDTISAGEGGPLRVLFCCTQPRAEELGRLLESLDGPGGLDAAVVVGDAGPRGWPLRAEDGQLVLVRLALSLIPLPNDRQSSPPPVPDAPPPAAPAPARVVAGCAAKEAPLVRVLGPVRVERATESMGGKALELVAYLACHPEGVSDDRLQSALWPERMPARGTFNNLVSLARRQLGLDADAQPHLPHALERRYRLAPLVGCDLSRFEALAGRAGTVSGQEAQDLLVRALEVVTGRPFHESDGYEWAHREGLVAAAERRVVNAAHHLAECALSAGDLERAEWAAGQGLRAAPGDEVLFRDRMLVAHAAGSTSAVESIMDELRAHLNGEDPLDALHPDTLELHHRLGQRPLARR